MIELKGPSISEIKNFIKEKSVVEFHLTNSERINGQILWYDDNAFHIQADNNTRVTILKSAVLYYYKTK